jgi:hypothetical protein
MGMKGRLSFSDSGITPPNTHPFLLANIKLLALGMRKNVII